MELFAIIRDTIYFVIRVTVSFIIVKVLTEAVLFMSEIMKNVSDIASSPKTQGLVGLVTGGVWTYDAVMDAASDLLILVSLISGIMAIIGYFSARARNKRRESQEEADRQERMRMEREDHARKMEILSKELHEKEVSAQVSSELLNLISKKHSEEAQEVIKDLISERKIIRMNSKEK